MISILSYGDKISVAPGESISFMVSCEDEVTYDARIVRMLCTDDHPDGPGYKELVIESSIEGRYHGCRQPIIVGSHVIFPDCGALDRLNSFTLQVLIWPTTPEVFIARGLVHPLVRHQTSRLRLGDRRWVRGSHSRSRRR